MNKKSFFAFIATAVLTLTGCMDDVRELYDGHAYDTGDFMQNYYSTWNESLKNNVAPVAKTYTLTSANAFQIETQQDLVDKLAPTDSQNSDGTPYDLFPDTPKEDAGYGYGPSNNLISIDESSFSRGFLSRLYDGRIHCDGSTYAQTRVQVDQSGYSTLFNKELMDYRYFALSMKGADDSEKAYPVGVFINLSLKFYVYDYVDAIYVPYLFQFNNFEIMTNSGMSTTIIGFYFEFIMQNDFALLSRASGMSIEYEFAQDYSDLTSDRNEEIEGKNHFALMLYEVLLPKSTWN
ncbi:MAG: hypothetical protein WC282_03375 [Bacilli bacterium]|jgi:hypothetical protein